MTSIIILAIEIFTFCLVSLVSVGLFNQVDTFVNVRRRLGDKKTRKDNPSDSAVLKSQNVKNPFLQWVQSSTSINDSNERAALRRDLAMAGFEQPAAPVWFVITRFGLAILLPVLWLVGQPLFGKPMTGVSLIGATLLLSAAGLLGPRIFVDTRIKARREQMEREFPDALDLLVVCVEAGLGLEAAFVRVGQEVRESHPRTSQEFGRLAQEMSAGRSRADALRALADRVGVDTVKSFVALMIQTDALGVSIGQTLRTYSIEMREHRFLRAEEKAMRIPVLMTIPLVVCILPVIITALMLPAAIDMMRTLLPALRGQH